MNQCFYSKACYVKYRQQFNMCSIIFFDGSILSVDQQRLSRDSVGFYQKTVFSSLDCQYTLKFKVRSYVMKPLILGCLAPPGGVLLEILGVGVPPGFPNPDPISDQKMEFSTPVFRPNL